MSKILIICSFLLLFSCSKSDEDTYKLMCSKKKLGDMEKKDKNKSFVGSVAFVAKDEKVKKLHEKDLKGGYGDAFLPDALERKYPNAGKEWRWQYIFPSARARPVPLETRMNDRI